MKKILWIISLGMSMAYAGFKERSWTEKAMDKGREIKYSVEFYIDSITYIVHDHYVGLIKGADYWNRRGFDGGKRHGYGEGYDIGVNDGYKEGYITCYKQSRLTYDNGYNEGYDKGYHDEGYVDYNDSLSDEKYNCLDNSYKEGYKEGYKKGYNG